MGHPIIGSADWDDATITPSEEAVNFPAINLLRHGVGYRWESQNATGIKSFLLEAPEQRSASLVGLFHQNGTELGGFRVRYANGGASEILSNPVADSDVLGPCLVLRSNLGQSGSATDASWTQSDFSIEFHYTPEHAKLQTILLRTGAGGDQPYIGITAGGKFILSDSPSGNFSIIGTTTVVAGTRYHVSATYDSGTTTATLIVNGVQEASNSSVTGWATGDTLTLSSNASGDMNELRYWDFARSAAAVDADKDDLLVGTESGLLGVWNFEDGTAPVPNGVAGGPDLNTSPGYFGYATDRLWATPDLALEEWRNGYLHVPLGVSCDTIQVDVLDSSNPDGRLIIGRLLTSQALQTSKCTIRGSDYYGARDDSPVSVSERGSEAAFVIAPRQFYRVNFEIHEEQEVARLSDIYQRSGRTRDVAFVRDPESSYRAGAGVILGRLEQEFHISLDAWQLLHATTKVRGL